MDRDQLLKLLCDELTGYSLRNFTVILGAIIGLSLAFWRSKTANTQAKMAQQQANVAEKGLLNDRYQRSAEMLGSATLATRIGGIYALERLAREHPEEYHIQIMDSLCAFVRHSKIQTASAMNAITSDAQEALTVIGRRNQDQLDLEKEEKERNEWRLNLSKACLRCANLRSAHLEGADLRYACLEGAELRYAHLEDADLRCAHLEDADLSFVDLKRAALSNAHLEGAVLSNARLGGANLHCAHLEDSDLSFANLLKDTDPDTDRPNTDLSDAILDNATLQGIVGLTQEMLCTAAHFDQNNAPLPGPDLTRAFCAETGKQLEWKQFPNFSSSSGDGESDG